MYLVFSAICIWNIIIRKIKLGVIINVHRSSCEVPVILVRFQCNLNFPDRFSKSTRISNLMKSVQWEQSCSMRTDEQTDRNDEANSRFSQFCKSS